MIKNNRYDLGMKLGGYTLHIDVDHVDPALYELTTGTKPFSLPGLVADIGVAIASHNLAASIAGPGHTPGPALDLGGPAQVMTACIGWLHQDEDAHETCSLTACLNPLHPGPCKGWKGNLFKVAPNAYHALESARVEKANAARLKKIQALKDAGKPIPKKLLQPIVAKPHPHAGKTANAATGEAHAAGQAVTEAAGVHVQTPGKVTLGQAVKQLKATDATTEKGKLGKKPTVASKGIAAVIAQEKVTPQYKLDKASKITPEQWNALSGDEKAIIRGELAKIQTEGFGPQQKKATELLDALPATGLKGGGTDTITTPKGTVHQKVTLKDLESPPTTHPSPVKKPIEVKALNEPGQKPAGASSADQVSAIVAISNAVPGVKSMESPEVAAKLVEAFDKLKAKGNLEDQLPFKAAVDKIAQAALKTADQDKTPGVGHGDNDIHIGTLNKEIKEHILAGKPGLPPMVQKIVDHHEQVAPKNVKEGIEQAAKAAHEAKVAEAKPSGLPPALSDAQKNAHQALYGQMSTEKKISALTGLTSEEFKGLTPKEQGSVIKALTSFYQYNPDLRKTVAEAMVKYTDGPAKSMWEKQAAKPSYTPTMTQVGKHLLESGTLGKGKANTQERLATYKALTPEEFGNLSKQEQAFVLHELTGMQKNPKVDSKTVQGILDKLTGKPNTEAKAALPKPTKLGDTAPKAVHEAKVAEAKTSEPEPPKIENAAPSAPEKPATLPKHVQHAIDMATGTAPGASWSKNHLAAYEKLTPEEFAALPPDVQSKVIQELKKGATKFLDPKKIQATSELLKKFKGGLEASKPAAPSEPGFHSHINDHSVTDAQAKKLAAGQPVAAHAAVAKELAGLDLADQPDVMAHHNAAKEYGKNLLTSFTKDEPVAALKEPAVQQAAQDVLDAATTLKQAQLVGQAKKNAYNKIDKTLKGDTGQLSPIQKASLAEYQKYLLAHPTKTEPEDITKLQTGVLDATDKLRDALKAAKAPKPDEMTPAQLDSKVSELLGPDAVKPQVNLTMAELKEANATGEALAKLGTEKYSPAVLENPEVAAKMKVFAQVAGQLVATAENKKKLQAHLTAHHYKALKDHDAGVGNFNAPQLAAIKAHAEKLKKEHAYLDSVTESQQAKMMEARAAFDKVVNEVQAAHKEPVTLSEYDQNTVSEAFGNSWAKAASKAVTYGLKTYSQKLEMKGHAEYPAFTQDLGSLQTAVKNLAVAHAVEQVAELNVSIDPDTGAKLDGPEKKAWLSAVTARMDAEKQYNQLYKVAQTRLDKIRTDIGLKKRALPKIDSPAIKAAAAESGYYKTAVYGGPNYGKQAKAKNYILAKVGPKLGIVHQSASEKKAEKAAAEAEKLKAAHSDFYAKKEADEAANTTKPKVSVDDAGKTPNQAAAEKLGWNYLASTGPQVGQWHYSTGPAYYANADHLKEAQDILSGPDVLHGLAAQKQFKWSINNMESKGASHSWKSSLYNYTGTGYDSVNTKLNSLPPGVAKTGSTAISNIDNGIAASPELEADTVLYRGFKSPHTVFSSGKWNDTNVAGMEWSQRSYSSTSGSLSIAQGFAGYGGVVMRIIIPKGMKVHGINAKGGQHPGESEIILQRGLRYRVVADYGKHGSDGKRYIDVMVVPNPYAKPE